MVTSSLGARPRLRAVLVVLALLMALLGAGAAVPLPPAGHVMGFLLGLTGIGAVILLSTRARLVLAPNIPSPLDLLWSRRPWVSALFMIGSFFHGLAWFIALLTMISTGLGLAVTLIGIPVLALTMVLWTLGARAERWWIGVLFKTRIPPPYRELPVGSWVQRSRAFATDPAVWKDLVYLVLLFPIGLVQFVLALVVITVPLAMVTAPLHYQWGSEPGVWFLHGSGHGELGASLLSMLVGLPLFLVVTPYVLTGAAAAHVAFAKLLLGRAREEELEARVDTLTESRSRAVDAALAERRRIERDLHDGAQQRLVALAMELGMAKMKMDSDPAAARELVDKAHGEAKQALADIRALVRGIHPAVLTDRGLDAAISALAGRCPVPVGVIVELESRPPEVVESTAYFVVAEALTNIAKHSVATEALVNVWRAGGQLVVEVSDNGLGGADPSAGTGLAGLADRLVALDGRLTVHSPTGGPTRVRAEIPWPEPRRAPLPF